MGHEWVGHEWVGHEWVGHEWVGGGGESSRMKMLGNHLTEPGSILVIGIPWRFADVAIPIIQRVRELFKHGGNPATVRNGFKKCWKMIPHENVGFHNV